MYVPPAFREERLDELHAVIRRTGLATLVTAGPEGPVANHVPLVLDPGEGPYGTLYGHLARGNPQWRSFDGTAPALAIFQGPEAYVSPSWYPGKAEHGQVVPTWNYVAVHATGPATAIEDGGRLRALLDRLTDRHEAGRAEPWAVSDAPEAFTAKLMAGIVGFALRIERLEGKWKLSQNRPAADRRGVVEGLAGEGPGGAEVARAMRELDRDAERS